eukprot:365864-Chlamydomonas_euryale.AAC.10
MRCQAVWLQRELIRCPRRGAPCKLWVTLTSTCLEGQTARRSDVATERDAPPCSWHELRAASVAGRGSQPCCRRILIWSRW